jgi:hypothetical protein
VSFDTSKLPRDQLQSEAIPHRRVLFRRIVPMHLAITFDRNTLASMVSPETAQRDTGAGGAVVRTAIEARHVQGAFSETLVTMEGVEKKDRLSRRRS